MPAKTKKCSRCKKAKSWSEFSPRANGKPNAYCKPCRVDYQREWLAKNPKKMRKHVAYGERRRVELRQWVEENFKSGSCADCGVDYPPYVLEFDHLNPVDKVQDVGEMVNRRFSRKKIVEEIEKCDLVCANCHKTREHFRRNKLGDA